MNNQEAFLLYTMQNMQNSQLPCFIPSISLKPFPHLAHSICHLSTHSSHSSFTCFVMLPAFSSSQRRPLQLYVVFQSISLVFSPPFPTLSISTCPIQPHAHPYIYFPPLSLLVSSLPLCISPQCKSCTCDTLLQVSSHLNGMCGLAISDSSRQEVRANLYPTFDTLPAPVICFHNTNMSSLVKAHITKL